MFCCLAALPGRFWPGERDHLGLQLVAGRRGGPALASHDVGLAYPGQATLGLTDNMEGLERNISALRISQKEKILFKAFENNSRS